MQDIPVNKGPAVVFGALGEQGRAVIEGLIEASYQPVYGVSRHDLDYLDALEPAIKIKGDIACRQDVSRILQETQAPSIFVVTTTDMPTSVGIGTGFHVAMEDEYEVLMGFFQVLVDVYKKDHLERHVVLSTLDNVQELSQNVFELTGKTWIEPLDDGSIVPHYSGKGRAGEEAATLLEPMEGLALTRLTLPFLHSNFLGFFVPLPNEGGTQWSISACLGDSPIDMMSTRDLGYIVAQVLEHKSIYGGKNLRLSAEKLSMDQVAAHFADLFGKDVIYNPLTVEEVAKLPFPAAGCMAQMCTFLKDPRSLQHDVELTEAVLYPRRPQLFYDWLLTHSDHEALEQVGLSVDAPEITYVTVFGATSLQGTSVVKGLLADERKQYKVRATTRHVNAGGAKALVELDPNRVELFYADYDNDKSCLEAVDGVDGAFLVTEFMEGAAEVDLEAEERHAKNVIDACELSSSVRHLVFSTLESVEEMNQKLQLGLENQGGLPKFDAKARAAAYARTKRLSVTFVLMPCYSEMFLEVLKPQRRVIDGKEKVVMGVPLKDDTKVMCMSVEDLGPAVANIFDSYQVYAGHEIGLVTDFVTISEVADILSETIQEQDDSMKVEQEHVEMNEWIEASQDSYMKDLGQIFAYMSKTEAVQKRRSIAKTMKLVPTARPLKQWVEGHADDPAFREKLGLR